VRSPSGHVSFPTHNMADQSGSIRFRTLFQVALQDYEKKTSVTLVSHPLAMQFQSYHSAESITTGLQGQVLAFGEFEGSDRVMKSIEGIVSILTKLSATPSLGDAIGLVRHEALRAYSIPLTVFTAIPTCQSNTRWSRYPTCCMCHSLVPM
jgi:hypothetical protein